MVTPDLLMMNLILLAYVGLTAAGRAAMPLK